jgi:multidrug efflux pump subunit AcrA (membrane-fusion protein)
MWIVRLALRRPLSVAVMALLMLVLGVLSFTMMNIDIFPAINLPVVMMIYNYPGLSAIDMERRIVLITERAYSTTVNDIEHIESESIEGLRLEKIYFQPGTDIGSSIAQLTAATLHPLRVYADVPQDAAAFIKDGDPASLTVTQYPGKTFMGTVTRHPEALDQNTRTMRVEVDLPNKDSLLYPGMYATLRLNVVSGDPAPKIPDDALVFRNGKTYAPVVRNNHIHLAPVTLGTDNGREVEIASGIAPGDLVAMNVGNSVEEGDPVQPVLISAATPID